MAAVKSLLSKARDLLKPTSASTSASGSNSNSNSTTRRQSQTQQPSSSASTTTTTKQKSQPTSPPPSDHPFSPQPLHLISTFPSTTHPQSKSPLFALPPEIRLLIWRECLGDRVIPLQATVRRTGRSPHRSRGQMAAWFACEPAERPAPEDAEMDVETGRLGVLGILKTCKRVHAETIDILYTTNTIYLKNASTLLIFTHSTHPAHLHLIRHLIVNLDYRYPPTEHSPPAMDQRRPVIAGFSPQPGLLHQSTPSSTPIPLTTVHRLNQLVQHDHHMAWEDCWKYLDAFEGLVGLEVFVGSRYWHEQKAEEHLYSDDWMWPEVEAEVLGPAERFVGREGLGFRLVVSWPKGDRELGEGLEGVLERTTDTGGAVVKR